MKMNFTKIRYLAVSLLIAVTTLAVMPQPSMAQRTRTDKGKVAVKRTAKQTTSKRSGTSRSGKATTQRSGNTRSGNATTQRSGNTRSGNATTQRSGNTRSGNASTQRSGDAVNRNADRSRVTSGSRSNTNSRGTSGARSGNSRSVDNSRSVGNSRSVINGNRSGVRVNQTQRAPIVVRKGKVNVRYAPKVYINANRRYTYRRNSRINVHISWPWVVRLERRWSPRYRYRQVVHINTRWGSGNRVTRVEMETVYRHKVKYATDDYAVLDIDIEEIALYEGDRYLGTVDRIPSRLSSIEATVYRDGAIAFDRDVFLVGDRRSGFELISTEFYDDYAMARYRDRDGYRAGKLNLRSGKVTSISRSRLFNPRDFRGYAPISLLPENEGWLWDYGVDAISAVSDDYDSYYGYDGGSRSRFSMRAPRENTAAYSYSTDFGAEFSVERQSSIQRVE